MGFLDGVAPPAEHRVEHDQQADEEQSTGLLTAEYQALPNSLPCKRLHPADPAESP
jgi:hypothetical protein